MRRAEELLLTTFETFIAQCKGLKVPDRTFDRIEFGFDIHRGYEDRLDADYELRTQGAVISWFNPELPQVCECTLNVFVVGTIPLNRDESYPLDYEDRTDWRVERICAEWDRPDSVKSFFEVSGDAAFAFLKRLS